MRVSIKDAFYRSSSLVFLYFLSPERKYISFEAEEEQLCCLIFKSYAYASGRNLHPAKLTFLA
jgi:hypothetical protein